MNDSARPSTSFRRLAVFGLMFAIAFGAAYAWPAAQAPAKKALTVDDYTRWRSINASEMSGDGVWVSYGMSFTNTAPADSKPELHLLNLDTNQDLTIAGGSGGNFSADSKWFAYQVDPGNGGRGAGRGNRGGGGGGGAGAGAQATNPPAGGGANANPAQQRRVELRNLATGEITQWPDVASFSFSSNSTYFLLRRRPPTPAAAAPGRGAAADTGGAPGGGGGGGGGGQAAASGAGVGAETNAARGVDVTLYTLATKRSQLIGQRGRQRVQQRRRLARLHG